MAITGTDKIFSVNDSEYGYTIKDEKPVASGGSIDIYVPKLMGDIDKVTPETINIDKLFDNIDLYNEMSNKSRSLGIDDSSTRIYEEIRKIIR